MSAPLGRFSEPVYALFRIVVGGLFMQHGLQKILGLLGGEKVPVGGQMWVGGLIEMTCGLLVLIGFFAGWAAFLASGTMAVAYFQFHQPNGGLPIQNHGEPAVLYCFAFLLIAAKGAGIWSVDAARRK